MDTATATLDEVVEEFGPLDRTYGLFVPNTINTGTQLSAERITNETLRDKWFYTANTGLATIRNGKLLLGIGGNAAFNVVFGADTESVCTELKDKGYVNLKPYQIGAILILEKSGEVVFVDPKNLNLQGNDSEYMSFPIRTANYDKDVTTARAPFVNAGFGSGDMLSRVMDNLKSNGNISETGVYTMNPEHAAENFRDNEIVARAGRLGVFGVDSRFSAVGRDVGYAGGALRGVLRKSAEGAAPQIVESLDKRITLALDTGQAFQYQGQLYVPVSNNAQVKLG